MSFLPRPHHSRKGSHQLSQRRFDGHPEVAGAISMAAMKHLSEMHCALF